ncbi:SMC-Scp complex subunit ScpB [Paenibacillus athensensis]|uniref:Segregation and condensation protein B n=1 Tax=Paenibacillus athensensis TaxID=1967502 RepID=A0A4Y8PS46_9BACL|nr:SMC-Scp complex subunit ScpB [Paenibacillus athensensis]MCD1260757.1 SMC-Scp complex subunit ScpB [Paenibacillus athensensis]
MNFQQMKSVIEGLLFAAGDEGLDAKQLAEVLEHDVHLVTDLLYDLKGDLERGGRGIQIVEVAGSFQLTTRAEHAPYFERLAYTPSRSSLSQAALETLSIIAYKQPITRVEIEEIRGVKCDRALQTLMGKDLIVETGRAEAVGRPILYGTSKQFLEYFGLGSIADLPESTSFQIELDLEEETRMLFNKLDGPEPDDSEDQLTMEDVASGEVG